jgi:hypothetical protein
MKNKLENIYKECPKTFEMYKKYLIDKYKDKEELPGIESFLTDNMLQLNIQTAPMSLTYFFDTLEFIGCVCYNDLLDRFEISLNGELIKEEDKQNEHLIIGSSDRMEAEKILIKYLFIETEKIL